MLVGIIEQPALVLLLILPQVRNHLPNSVQVAPATHSEQPDPAVEDSVEQAAVPRLAIDFRHPQGLGILPVPAAEIERALSAVGRCGHLNHMKQPLERRLGAWHDPQEAERTMASGRGKVPLRGVATGDVG